MDFIELTRVVTNRNGIKVLVPEVLQVSEIKTFRPWHKTAKDDFDGDATLIVLFSKKKMTGKDPSEEVESDTMLISEKYEDLRDRLSGRVIIVGAKK
jgi:hypothetical protein